MRLSDEHLKKFAHNYEGKLQFMRLNCFKIEMITS
jgi:hypothetical protein